MAQASSSPRSPAESIQEPPALDVLVEHFVAAKRSLSSTAQVYRANEIVQDARRLVEEHAVLSAKSTFVRNGLNEQLHVLHTIGAGVDSVSREAQVDFQVDTSYASTSIHVSEPVHRPSSDHSMSPTIVCRQHFLPCARLSSAEN